MAIAGPPEEPSDVASTVLALFGQLHDQIRHAIAGLDDVAVNWAPGAETNSIATIVTHVVGSEAETIRTVAGVTDVRDREAEFTRPSQTREQLVGVLARADLLLAAMGPRIDAERLRARVALPTLPSDEQRSGLAWLVGNYGHAREHLGQIQLTAQLYGMP
jgi:hypothetical protein